MVPGQDNICLTIGGGDIVVVVYGNELEELKDNAVDAGGPFWYIMGTDAWFEKEERDTHPILVARNREKIFCSFPLDEALSASLVQETGILVLFPDAALDTVAMQQLEDPGELPDWLSANIGEAHYDGLIFCFYREQDKAKYHFT